MGLSQSEMVRHLGADESFSPARISEYELGIREPSLWILLAYGRAARVHLESIIDDDLTLPEKIPNLFDYRQAKRRS